jgi:hypothetical protein
MSINLFYFLILEIFTAVRIHCSILGADETSVPTFRRTYDVPQDRRNLILTIIQWPNYFYPSFPESHDLNSRHRENIKNYNEYGPKCVHTSTFVSFLRENQSGK